MNRSMITERIADAFERGYISDDALTYADGVASTLPAPGAVSAQGAPAPSSSVEAASIRSRQLLADSIHFLTDTPKPPTSKKPLKALSSFDGGLEISFFGSWGACFSDDSILSILKPLKEKARLRAAVVPLCVGDVQFMVHPNGAKLGWGNFSYQLIVYENGREKFWFQLHTNPQDSIPGVRVKCCYEAFRSSTLKEVYSEVIHILQVIGFEVKRETLSRIDFNVTVNRSIDDFSDAYNNDKILNRCDCATYGSKKVIKSYRFGRSTKSIQLAVYDKLNELQNKYDAEKIDDIVSVFGSDVDVLTRYEFRLGRDFLNSLEIDTIDDFLDSFVGIVDYLTHNWFLVIDSNSRKHCKRSELQAAPFWQEIRSALLIYAITGERIIDNTQVKKEPQLSQTPLINIIGRYRPVVRNKPRKKFRTKLRSLFNIGVGCFVSAVAFAIPEDQSFSQEQFSKTMSNVCSFYASQAYKSFNERRLKFQDMEIAFEDSQFIQEKRPTSLLDSNKGALYV